MRTFLFFSLIIFIFPISGLEGQSEAPNREAYRIQIGQARQEIRVDGVLDEPAWTNADIADHFHRVLPTDTGFARAQTEVSLVYDHATLYMGIVCYDPWPGKRPVESLRRDFSFGKNDNFIAFIDTYSDQTNGFAFGISAAGAQWEGLQANGGFVNLDWDGKWYSAVVNYEDKWVVELAIPFRTIRYKIGVKEWGINFSRLDLKGSEKSSWAPVPRQFQTANLAYAGTLVWDQPPPDLGLRFSLIPYVSGRSSKNVEEDLKADFSGDVGLDAKITLSTSLNLDLTLNPDFSQVEVDRQVINLDRFELFFPEKRQFFLENSDLFASLGSTKIRPFFSRRIGLTSPVIGGARLSGQLGKDWRIGLMNIQTDVERKTSKPPGNADRMPANNFMVAALQKQIWQRSNLNIFLINKTPTGALSNNVDHAYNRVAGFDFNLASADNRWTGKAFYHQAFYPDASREAFAASTSVAYQTQQLSLEMNQAWVGDDFIAETGFVPRNGFIEFNPTFQFKFFPTSLQIANHGPIADVSFIFDDQFNITDQIFKIGYQMQWLDRRTISGAFTTNQIKLRRMFDPTNTGGISLPIGETYDWVSGMLNYTSDIRKAFNYELGASYGGYYNGKRLALLGTFFYRIQPWGSFSVVTAYNDIDLPDPYQDATLFLIGPRIDFTFTDKIFLTTFVQYNDQIDNLNVNMRFQWRFAPVSDLFIVYTSNAYPDGLRTKNRAIVAKISYWFN